MESKHEIEEYYFKKFKQLYPELADGKVSRPEPPDFIIDTGTEIISIEITQIHNEKGSNDKFPPAQKHANEDSILKAAEGMFSLRRGIPLHIRFHFSNNILLNAKQRGTLSEQICQLIEGAVQDKNLLEQFSFTLQDHLPNELLHIDGHYFPNVTAGCWYSGKGRFLPNLTKREILNVIQKKEKSLIEYIDKVNQAILVMCEGDIPNSFFDEVETFESGELVTRFDRIFIIRRLSEQLVQIK